MNNEHFPALELVGLPGAGKTTILPQLISELNSNSGLTFQSFEDFYPSALLMALNIPNIIGIKHITRRLIDEISVLTGLYSKNIHEFQMHFFQAHQCFQKFILYSANPDRREELVRAMLYYEHMFKTLQKSSTNKKLIWDGGFTQRGLSLLNPPQPDDDYSNKDITKFIASIPKPSVIVIIDSNIENILDRRQDRISKSNTASTSYYYLSRSELKEVLTNMKECLEMLVTEYSSTDTKVIPVNNNNSVSTTVDDILDNINLSEI